MMFALRCIAAGRRISRCARNDAHAHISLTYCILCLLALLPVSLSAQQASYDLIIRNGHIVDGAGSPWYAGDIAIRDGKIAAIGAVLGARAGKTIDAHGMVVAPGFIDMLGQSDLTILVRPDLPSKIFQGITTEFTGEGSSVAPLNARIIAADRLVYDHLKITPDWQTLGQYFARLERQRIGINVGDYVGATQVRRMVIGDDNRPPKPEELERMRRLVREAMQDGAMGLSTSLQYPPAPYAKTDELIALAGEASRYGGSYATHMRSESDEILPALDEAIRIGREAKLPVEIWHIKVAGKRNFGRMPEVIRKIDSARKAGVDIAADTYAYTAWFNSLSAMVPFFAHAAATEKLLERLKDPAARKRIRRDMETQGSWENNAWQEISNPDAILIGAVQNPELLPLQGKTLGAIAREKKADPLDALLDLLIADRAFTSVAVFGMDERDVTLALLQPWVSVNNDSEGTAPDGILGQEHPHPRAYGTFPRILRKYVREEKRLSLEEAIRKFSSLPAQRMHLADRGVLKAGMWADIVVFNPDSVRDLATFEKPNQLSEGMRWVLVNGVPVIADGKATGALPGKVLRGPGAMAASTR